MGIIERLLIERGKCETFIANGIPHDFMGFSYAESIIEINNMISEISEKEKLRYAKRADIKNRKRKQLRVKEKKINEVLERISKSKNPIKELFSETKKQIKQYEQLIRQSNDH